MDRIKTDDLKLREEVSSKRLERRGKLRDIINEGMPAIEKATAKYSLDEYYGKALGLVISGRARNAFDLAEETEGAARTLRHEHLRPELPAGPPADRGRHALRRGQLAQGRQLRQPLLGRSRRPDASA